MSNLKDRDRIRSRNFGNSYIKMNLPNPDSKLQLSSFNSDFQSPSSLNKHVIESKSAVAVTRRLGKLGIEICKNAVIFP